MKRVFWNGNEAAAYGKIAGGVRFVSYYPITPATDDAMTFERLIPFPVRKDAGELAALERVGAVAFQAEDELSAIAVTTGAAIAGARAATATSGPGFSLMPVRDTRLNPLKVTHRSLRIAPINSQQLRARHIFPQPQQKAHCLSPPPYLAPLAKSTGPTPPHQA